MERTFAEFSITIDLFRESLTLLFMPVRVIESHSFPKRRLHSGAVFSTLYRREADSYFFPVDFLVSGYPPRPLFFHQLLIVTFLHIYFPDLDTDTVVLLLLLLHKQTGSLPRK